MSTKRTQMSRVSLRYPILLGALLLLPVLQPDALVWAQSTQNITLISGSGPVGSRDPANRFTLDGGSTFQDAFVVTPAPPYAVIPGTHYISLSANSSGEVETATRFQTTFTLPMAFLNPSLTVQVHADNQAIIFLNGTQIGAQPFLEIAANFQNPPEAYTASNPSLFNAGTNILAFDIFNFSGPTAFDYTATVSFVVDCNDANPCTDDSFDPPSSACVHTDNTGLCNDGNSCTQADTCQAGACIGSNPVVCTALDQCHDPGTCDTGTGLCNDPEKPDGFVCNDGTACTMGDTCIGGTCVGGPPPPEVCDVVDNNCDGTIDEGCVGKTTGGGEIVVPGGRSNYGFVAQRKKVGDPASGQLEYHNHARDLNVHSTSILTLTVSGNTATFTGECIKNQAPCTFVATVEDNGEPGRNVDKFTIEVSGEPTEGAPPPIIKGNIQIHASMEQSQSALSAPNQTPNALAGAGGGMFPAGASFSGLPLTGLRFGTGVDIPGNGSATGTHEATLLGITALGQPQTITVEVAATNGHVVLSGDTYVSGLSSVDLGDGTPPLVDIPFSLTVSTDSQGQGTLAMVIDTVSLPVVTIDNGSASPPTCTPPPEVGISLAFVDTEMLSWSASDAAASYNLYRGSIDGGTWTFDHLCLLPALTSPGATDIVTPSLGEAFYYLVSGKNTCGEGMLGVDANGQPRPTPSPCL